MKNHYAVYLKTKEFAEEQELRYNYWLNMTNKLEKELKEISDKQDRLTDYLIYHVKSINEFIVLEQIFYKQKQLEDALNEQFKVSLMNLKIAERKNSFSYICKKLNI